MKKFIQYGSTILDVNEVVCANASDTVVTIILKNNSKELNVNFNSRTEANDFVSKIFNVGKE